MQNRIKIIRAEQRLTQEQLAVRAKISRTALAMIENEKTTPDGETIKRLVCALGVQAHKIFPELNPPSIESAEEV